MSSRAWIALSLSNSKDQTPPLFIKTSFSQTGYSVSLTDLTRIWSERLDKRGVFKRALDDNTKCEIDPTEDATQLKILLDKVEAGLTGVRRSSRSITSQKDDELTLHLAVPLPKPYNPLQWPIQLKQLSPTSFKNEVVLPIALSAYMQRQQIDDLIKHMREKDHVISKLLDRLEASGTNIAIVFPGATGARASKKGTERTQAAKHVRGLDEFDEQQWRAESEPSNKQSSAIPSVLLSVLSTPTLPALEVVSPEKNFDSWWRELDRSAITFDADEDEAAVSVVSEKNHENTMDVDTDYEEEENQFQRQATPPAVKRSQVTEAAAQSRHASMRPKSPRAQSDSETNEDDLDAPFSPLPEPTAKTMQARQPENSHSPAAQPSRSKKLCTIGCRGTKISPAKESAEEVQKLAHQSSDQDTTDGEDGSETAPISKTTIKSPTLGREPARKTKLGVIGGKKKEASSIETPSRPEKPVRKPGHVHSKIGGKSSIKRVSEDDILDDRRSTSVESVPGRSQNVNETLTQQGDTATSLEDPAETAKARADRKREDLKRQLEAKAHAPTKKKRRF